MKKKTFILSALMLILCSVSSLAQSTEANGRSSHWSVGLSGGWSYNDPSIDKGYSSDYSYKGQSGYNLGAVGRFQILDWLAVRGDIRITSRSYKMERNMSYMKGVYTKYRDTYIHLPIMADLSVGSKKLRGHVYLGGYIGSWVDAHRSGYMKQQTLINEDNLTVYHFDEHVELDSRRDNTFNAGLIGGLGLSYMINRHFEVMVEGFYMYDLTKSNKTSDIVSIPRYNNTTDVNVGVMYNF